MQHSATSGAFLRGAATRAPWPPSPSAAGARGPCCAAAAQNESPPLEARPRSRCHLRAQLRSLACTGRVRLGAARACPERGRA